MKRILCICYGSKRTVRLGLGLEKEDQEPEILEPTGHVLKDKRSDRERKVPTVNRFAYVYGEVKKSVYR